MVQETWYGSENVDNYERPLIRNLCIVERWHKAANVLQKAKK